MRLHMRHFIAAATLVVPVALVGCETDQEMDRDYQHDYSRSSTHFESETGEVYGDVYYRGAQTPKAGMSVQDRGWSVGTGTSSPSVDAEFRSDTDIDIRQERLDVDVQQRDRDLERSQFDRDAERIDMDLRTRGDLRVDEQDTEFGIGTGLGTGTTGGTSPQESDADTRVRDDLRTDIELEVDADLDADLLDMDLDVNRTDAELRID